MVVENLLGDVGVNHGADLLGGIAGIEVAWGKENNAPSKVRPRRAHYRAASCPT